jgi:hypothetical protein
MSASGLKASSEVNFRFARILPVEQVVDSPRG